MIQVKTFDEVDDLNEFLTTLPEDMILKIEWKITDDAEDYSEYFMVQYRK
ncbi:hypothetical protein [Paenibacillus sp. FSL H7-0331]|nr:hypothetical protein [Paenibacillus sp. FSL H7-0331]